MKAIVIHNFGGPEVLRLEEVQDLSPGSGEVLVEVKAVGVNPVETYQRAGSRGKVEFTPRALMRREADIRGVMLYYASEAEVREIHASIEAAAQAGAIRPAIQRRLPLAQAAEAHREVIEDPSHGKIVLIP